MPDLGVYSVSSQDIIFESFDGDAVVLDLGTGRYFGFSDLGSCVWEALTSEVPASAIVELGAADNRFGAAELEAFIGRLLEFGLIVPQLGGGGEVPSDALAARFAAAKEPLNVERHDELADLLKADPIHDVDEMLGWPEVRESA
jgi:hypothetical protein